MTKYCMKFLDPEPHRDLSPIQNFSRKNALKLTTKLRSN